MDIKFRIKWVTRTINKILHLMIQIKVYKLWLYCTIYGYFCLFQWLIKLKMPNKIRFLNVILIFSSRISWHRHKIAQNLNLNILNLMENQGQTYYDTDKLDICNKRWILYLYLEADYLINRRTMQIDIIFSF